MKDRGIIKWQGFFMPEHVGQLYEFRNDYYRVGKPTLDEYQLREIDDKLLMAIEFQLTVTFAMWEDGFLNNCEGKLHYIDDHNKLIKVADRQGNFITIDYKNIVGVEFVD